MYTRSSPRGPNRDPNRTLSNELLLLLYIASSVTDALSTILRLLGEELEEAS